MQVLVCAVGRLGTVRLRHGAGVTAVAFSPDGKRIASGGMNWRSAIWDAKTGRELRSFQGQGGAVLALAYSPDGKVLATAGERRSPAVMLWDADTGKALRQLAGHKGDVLALAFAPDGGVLASGGADLLVRLEPDRLARLLATCDRDLVPG